MAQGSNISANNILLLGGGVLAFTYFNKIAKQAKLYQSIVIRFRSVRIEGLKLIIDLSVLNPNSKIVLISSVIGYVYMNGTRVGVISNFNKQYIAENSESVLSLPVEIKLGNLINTIKSFVTGKKKMLFAFQGKINANGKTLDVNAKYAL